MRLGAAIEKNRATKAGINAYLTTVVTPCSTLNLPKEDLRIVTAVRTARYFKTVVRAPNTGLSPNGWGPPKNTTATTKERT